MASLNTRVTKSILPAPSSPGEPRRSPTATSSEIDPLIPSSHHQFSGDSVLKDLSRKSFFFISGGILIQYLVGCMKIDLIVSAGQLNSSPREYRSPFLTTRSSTLFTQPSRPSSVRLLTHLGWKLQAFWHQLHFSLWPQESRISLAGGQSIFSLLRHSLRRVYVQDCRRA